VRADRTPPYGGPAMMPTLSKLAASGALFEWAFSPGNVTRRSIPTLATGVSPTRVKGRVAGWALRLDPRHILLAERFRAAGYDTAGFFCCESFWGPRHRLGINRGIDHLVIEADGNELSKLARRWLDERRVAPTGRPAFVWIHFIEAHNWTKGAGVPRTPADQRRAYDRVLGRLDAFVARITEAFAGEADDVRPILAISADHGEGLGDHDWLAHSTDLYNSQIRVPLVFVGPGITPNRIAEPVGLADLPPTLLDLAGFVPPEMPEMDGRNLGPLIRGERAAAPEGGYAFAAMIPDRSVAAGVRAVVVGRYKLIEKARSLELYDVVADPDEKADLAKSQPERVQALKAVLAERAAIDATSPFTGLR
jgi:arylsulfatase A-like enzyme